MASSMPSGSQSPADRADHDRRPSPVPLAGPGTTRNRRLELRKNGFRGRAVEQRSITPTTFSTPTRISGSWPSTVNDLAALLDGGSDNTMHDRHDEEARRCSSNILQEVSNSSVRRKGRSRPRVDALVSIWQDENAEQEDSSEEPSWQLESSPVRLPADAPDLTRSKKKLQRSASDMVRDAMMEEKDQYIEHLESQLAATQTQLSSATSPTVIQARSLKMRALNAQIRALQDELNDWETKYHERIQEEVHERSQIEANLKYRIRSLEQDMETYAQNAKELQQQLVQTRTSLDAAESANMELEKRLDTFANIVATSPRKQDFTFTPFGERRGHARRQSALPRIPASGSMLPSSTSFPALGPPLPSTTSFNMLPPFATFNMPPRPATAHGDETLDKRPAEEPNVEKSFRTHTPAHSQVTNELDYAYSDGASKRDSMLSATSSRLSWGLFEGMNTDAFACPSTSKSKPSRRMRRFYAGSVMPKPLILSSATDMNAVPSTAPPMEPHESPPCFPFPETEEATPGQIDLDDSPASRGRRRAYTSAETLTPEDLEKLSPLVDSRPSSSEKADLELPRPQSNHSTATETTPRDYSSIGSAVGRNLLEELRRAKSNDSTSTSDVFATSSLHHASSALDSSPSNASPSQLRQRRILHQRSISEQTALPLRSRSRTVVGLPSLYSVRSSRTGSERTHGAAASASSQRGGKVVTVISDLWRRPYDVARRCFARGERLMLFSSGVNKLQWWLLSLLLGPIVLRRLLSSAHPLLNSSPSAQSWRRQWRRKRKSDALACADDVDAACPCHGYAPTPGLMARHSPWLWIKFSLTLAFAIGAAMKDGPATLLRSEWEGASGDGDCTCSGAATVISSGSASGSAHGSKRAKRQEAGGLAGRSLADELNDAGYEHDYEHEYEHDA